MVPTEDILVLMQQLRMTTQLKMGRYYSTTMCHYWDMSVK